MDGDISLHQNWTIAEKITASSMDAINTHTTMPVQ